VLTIGGRLDRPRLAERVFADPRERAALEAITHPRIRELAARRLDALATAGTPRAIYDVPLLIEKQLHEGMDGIVLVVAPLEVQIDRLRSRNGLDEAQARARIAAQMPLEAKRPYATWIVDNRGSREDTRRQVAMIREAMLALPSSR
jgi:dephospho-CoA kinase